MPVDAARVKALFVAALDLPDAPARAAFLAGECGPDADLRQRVERLLAAHAEAASLPSPLEGEGGDRRSPGEGNITHDLPAAPPSLTTDHHPAPDEGTVIGGRYKLLQPIGEGGMGTVWMAEQLHPVRRKVAVKLVKEGMDSRRVLARFEAERQALALMDHPHIAKVLDAGTIGTRNPEPGTRNEDPAPSSTPRSGFRAPRSEGRPYFVMELVKGVPLTRFCDDHRLTVPQRLELFQQICSAVQHAHQKGIIHRDLKPGNVLVESHDGRPVPKVIDFGLAKAVSELPLTDKSLFTAFGAVMGTPQYMAPEQASFSAVDVDTRADVYALGVILYELLTGSPPIGTDRLRAAALDEVLRVIREEEPPTPSQRLSTAEGVPSVAANRQTEPKKLGRLVRGELDWIVMKALAKDRGRRYETATGFGADVGRYLAGEPVLAGPPTAAYRLRKFVRRNRGSVSAVLLVASVLGMGVVGTTWGLIEAQRRRVEAAEARQKEFVAQAEVALQATRAEQAREREGIVRRKALVSVGYTQVALWMFQGQSTEALIRFERVHPEVAAIGRPDLGGDVEIIQPEEALKTASTLREMVERVDIELLDGLPEDQVRSFRTLLMRAAEQEQSRMPWSRGTNPDHAKAMRLAVYLAEANGVAGPAVYNSACALALASAELKIEPAEKSRRQALAVGYIRQLSDAGYFRHPAKGRLRRQELVADPDLDPLRNRPDFRSQVEEALGKQ